MELLQKNSQIFFNKHSVVHGCWFTDYLTIELCRWEKTHTSVITILMENIVRKILIPQIFMAGKVVHAQEKYG